MSNNFISRYAREIKIGDAVIGDVYPVRVIAGPCTIDRHIDAIVKNLADLGITMVRGGAWKPRSAPDAFRGFGEKGLKWLFDAAREYGMRIVATEVMDATQIDIVRRVRDASGFTGAVILWVGARTHDQALFEALGVQSEFVVMVKNSLCTRNATEFHNNRLRWVLAGRPGFDENGDPFHAHDIPGNPNVIPCLRGVEWPSDTVDRPCRFKPNFDWIPIMRELGIHAPICIDPSHSAGTRPLVLEHVGGALKYNPNILIVEGGYPEEGFDGRRGLCDATQSLSPDELRAVLGMVAAHNRRFA